MGKLIDADKLKRAILKIDDSWFDKGAVIDAIDEQPEAKTKKWMPVSKKYPKDAKDVWIMTIFGSANIAYLSTSAKCWDAYGKCYSLDEVIAWRPL